MSEHKIGYRIGGSFEDYTDIGGISFEILFPNIYDSYEEAENHNASVLAQMKKQDEGDVVIVLYQDGAIVDTIHWDEWWKYKCSKVKESKKYSGFVDANIDYEPYAAKFTEIFELYCSGKDINVWPMQYLAYWVEPVLIMQNDGSYTARKSGAANQL